MALFKNPNPHTTHETNGLRPGQPGAPVSGDLLPSVQGAGQTVDTAEEVPAQVRAHVVKPRRVYTWSCARCGQPFETKTYSKRYCSDKCKYDQWNDNKRNK